MHGLGKTCTRIRVIVPGACAQRERRRDRGRPPHLAGGVRRRLTPQRETERRPEAAPAKSAPAPAATAYGTPTYWWSARDRPDAGLRVGARGRAHPRTRTGRGCTPRRPTGSARPDRSERTPGPACPTADALRFLDGKTPDYSALAPLMGYTPNKPPFLLFDCQESQHGLWKHPVGRCDRERPRAPGARRAAARPRHTHGPGPEAFALPGPAHDLRVLLFAGRWGRVHDPPSDGQLSSSSIRKPRIGEGACCGCGPPCGRTGAIGCVIAGDICCCPPPYDWLPP